LETVNPGNCLFMAAVIIYGLFVEMLSCIMGSMRFILVDILKMEILAGLLYAFVLS